MRPGKKICRNFGFHLWRNFWAKIRAPKMYGLIRERIKPRPKDVEVKKADVPKDNKAPLVIRLGANSKPPLPPLQLIREKIFRPL
jgi:hypothetical protein